MPQAVADLGRLLRASPQTEPKKTFLEPKATQSFTDVLARSSTPKAKTPDHKPEVAKKASDDSSSKKADKSNKSDKSDDTRTGKKDKVNHHKKDRVEHHDDEAVAEEANEEKTKVVTETPVAVIAVAEEEHAKTEKKTDKDAATDDSEEDPSAVLSAIVGADIKSDQPKKAADSDTSAVHDAGKVATQTKAVSTQAEEQPTTETDSADTVPIKPQLKNPQDAYSDSDNAIPIPGFEKADEASPLPPQDADATGEKATDFATQLQNHSATKIADKVQAPQTHIAPEHRFAADNVDKIVSSVKTELMPSGGTMTLHLHPQDLGALEITVKMQDGTLSASFQTNNDEATRLLSHNLEQLKTTLETSGVSVDRIQVKQASSSDSSSNQQSNDPDKQQQQPQDHSARQEQQRKEMLQRMWRKLAFGHDEVDLVA